MSIPWLHRTAKFAIFYCLACWLQVAGAAPVSIAGITSGHRGDTVSPTLFDGSVTSLDAADIKLTFDSAFLFFLGASAGTLDSDFSVVSGAPIDAGGTLKEVLISLAESLDAATGGPGSLLVAMFAINANSPLGDTFVDFETRDPSLYDFPSTRAKITVLDAVGNTVPIGNTGGLVLMGLAAMFLSLRSAQPGKRRVALRKLA